MKKVFFLMCLFVAPLAFTACAVEDNPYPEVQQTVDVDNPQEEVTDQPAQAPAQ